MATSDEQEPSPKEKENDTDEPEVEFLEDAAERGERGEAEEDKKEVPDISTNIVDLEQMKNRVFFLFPDRNRRLSRFWLLLLLAAVIATSGVAGDSVATVIGAMIVAPLMTPILGTMLSIVLADNKNLLFSLLLVFTGAGSCILIGYVYGLCLNDDAIKAENNSQIASRTEPKLTDLIAALATGAVGSISLVRVDVADTLPGVAIAISLVPPLSVIGLTLSTGDGHDAAGAFLLFATNVASILFVGTIVMLIYKVHRMVDVDRRRRNRRDVAFVTLLLLLAAVAVPLGISSKHIRDVNDIENCLDDAIGEWADPYGWKVTIVLAGGAHRVYTAKVFVAGSPPFPDEENFPEVTQFCGVEELTLKFLPQRTIEL